MSKIIIPKSIDHGIVENLLSEITTGERKDLQLPTELQYRGFGIIGSLYLVLFTWMRTSPGKLIIGLRKDNAEEVEKFGPSYFAYVVLSTVWKHLEIVDLDDVNLKPTFRKYTESMFQKIDFLDTSGLPNNEVLLSCFDHYSRIKGLTHWLYPDHENFAETPSSLENTLYRVLVAMGKIYKTRVNNAFSELFEDVDRILWELFKNTDEHARKDYLNITTLSPNTRGVYFKIQQSSKDVFISNAKDHLGLITYYNKSLIPGNNLVFEISIFDSGPGLVKRYMGEKWEKSIDINEEVAIIKKCLLKGSSSVTSWLGKKKGYGLNEVLSLLNKRRGFLKIRSGRVALFRNLIEAPYQEVDDYANIPLWDWTSLSSEKFTQLKPVEGTLLTMAFPLP